MTRQALIILAPPPHDRRAHDLCERAYEFFTNPTNFGCRKTWCHQILRRKRQGTRAEPIRMAKGKGVYTPAQVDTYQKERKVAVAADLFRLLAWAIRGCNWRNGEVGDFRDGRVQFLSRAAIADRAGFPVRVDKTQPKRPRVRTYKLCRRQQDLIAAGLLIRVQVDGLPSVLKLSPIVWEMAGLARRRKHYADQEDDKRGKVGKATREGKPAAVAHAQVVAQLASQADARPSVDWYARSKETADERRERWRAAADADTGDPPT